MITQHASENMAYQSTDVYSHMLETAFIFSINHNLFPFIHDVVNSIYVAYRKYKLGQY